MRKLTTKEFIERARAVHGHRYDYSKVEYINTHIKVCIICPEHEEFWQSPNCHTIMKQGCPTCGNKSMATKQTLSKTDFVNKSSEIHNDKYDYSKSNYTRSTTKVLITCPIHGDFRQIPADHIRGIGCPGCAFDKNASDKRTTLSKFIQNARSIHGDKYDYSKVKYKNVHTKVCIICPEHGEFWQIPGNHIHLKQNCPLCSTSKGENEIREILSKRNITFIEQQKFTDCINKRPLPFDFYLPELNTCIEYDGIQHFKPIDFFGGEEIYEYTKRNDQIKTEYCKENNIRLIRIRYDEDIEILHHKI